MATKLDVDEVSENLLDCEEDSDRKDDWREIDSWEGSVGDDKRISREAEEGVLVPIAGLRLGSGAFLLRLTDWSLA